MSLSQSSEINLTDSSKKALKAQNTANTAQATAEAAQSLANQNQQTVANWKTDFEAKVKQIDDEAEASKASMIAANNAVVSDLAAAKTSLDETRANLATTANDLSTAKASLTAGLNDTKTSLATTANDLSATKASLEDTKTSLTEANSAIASDLSNVNKDLSDTKNDLANTKTSLTASLDDAKKDIATTANDLSNVKTNLEDTKNSLSTTVSDLQKQTGQLSGSLETANSKIEYNSNAIAEVKHTADGISTTVSNIRVGGRNLLRNSDKLPYFGDNNSSWSTGQWRIAGITTDTDDMKRVSKEITDPPQGDKATTISYTGILRSSVNDISLVAINSIPISGNVTVSFWARQTSNVNTAFVSAGWSGRGMANTNASTECWGTTKYRKLFLPKDGSWTRFWATFNVNNNENVYIGAGNTGTSAEVQICLVKIETGTMSTDWTPAPEDTDQAISKISQTADTIRADLTNTQGDVASVKAKADSLQSQITDNKNNISSVKQTADSLTTRMSNAEGNVSGLQQTASKLQSDLTDAKGNINSLQQTASGLTSTVSNMKSGGANMLPAGQLQARYGSTVTYDSSSDTYTIVNPASANAKWGSGVSLPNAVIEVPWGQTACISMQVYSPTAGTIEVDINNGGDGVTTGNDNDNRDKATFHNMDVSANTWTTVWFTYENSSESCNPKKVSLWDNQSGIGLKLNNVTWQVRHPMVQIGTFPSEWSPSPKDTDQAISKVSQTADAIRVGLTNTQGDVASVKATASAISTDLTSAKGDISSLQQTASGLTSRVGNAEGNISQLQQTANGLTSTVSNLHAGDRNYARNTSNEWTEFTGFTGVIDYLTPILGTFFLDDLKVGDTVTIGYTIKNDGIQSGIFWLQFLGDVTDWNTGNFDGTHYDITRVCPDGATTTLIQYYTLTADNLKNSKFNLRIRTDNFPAGTLSYKGFFVKKGNLATDWSPAPEDTDQAISKISQTADAIRADLTNTNGDVASVKATANAISTDLTNAKGNIASVKATADSLATSMANANGQIGTLQERADSITTTLSQGGSNLLSGTSGDLKSATASPWWVAYKDFLLTHILDNRTCTARVWIDNPSMNCILNIWTNKQSWISNTIKANQSGYATVTFTITDTSYTDAHIAICSNSGTVTFGYKELQIEYGDTATPWKPSNGDISSLQQTAQGLTARVGNAEGNISQLQLTANGLTSTVSNLHSGDRNLASGVASSKDWFVFSGFTGATNYCSDLVNYSLDTLKAGDKVTFGITMKNDGITSGTMYFQQNGDISLWNRDFGGISSPGNVTDFVPNGAEKTLTYTISITAGMLDGNNTYTIAIRTDNIPAGGKLSFRYAFVKKGTMSTDWTPAPEDTDQAISKVSQTADTISADLTNAKNDIASVKVTANSLNSSMTNAKSDISSLQQTAGGLTTRVGNAENNISQLQITANGLTSEVGKFPDQWQQAINDKASAKVLDSWGDMNYLTTSGTYLVKNSSIKNAPIPTWFMATVEATSDGASVVQRVKKDNYNTAYERSKNYSGWTNWERVATGTDVSSIQQTVRDITARVGSAEGNISQLQITANGLNSTVSQLPSKWQQDINNKASAQVLNDWKDMNYLTTAGTYLVKDTSIKNAPISAWFMATVEATSDGTRVVQRVKKYTDNITYERSRNYNGWTNWERVATGTDISYVSQKADSITAYVKNSTGSKILSSILEMDPNNSTIGQVVNGNIVSAINTSSDGSTKLWGRNIELNGDTTVTGNLNLLPKDQQVVNQFTQGLHNPWFWRNSKVFAGAGGLQLQSTIASQGYTDGTSIGGIREDSSAAITTLAPTYLKFTIYPTWNDFNNNFSNQLARTYIDAGRIETNDVWTGSLRIIGHHIRVTDDQFLMVSNHNGTNFDGNGSVGFQVYGGIVLGQNTIGAPGDNLYFQRGNVNDILNQRYSDAPKLTLHADHIVSQSANKVSSRLSVKTDITKVTYDRALAAVEGTEMYDYRYISDDSGQHYVSGIIDDVNPEPQYHMDDMLINKERTARIDANLTGYHHVIIQKLLERVATLETNNQQLLDRVTTLEAKIK